MARSDRSFETLSKLVLSGIAIVLGVFLSFLGNKVLSDVTKMVKPPLQDQFLDQTAASKVEAERKTIEKECSSLREQVDQVRPAVESAEATYRSEMESFDAWVRTRSTLGSPDQDQEVLTRNRRLDELRGVRDQWKEKAAGLQRDLDEKASALQKVDARADALHREASTKFQAEYKHYALLVFLLRLLIALPVLAVGVFLFQRFRKGRFAAFVWGLLLFSLYMFFVGLVPYLPSYGGYIRYTVGIALTLFLGYKVIRALQAYTERKKAELARSTEDRAKEIAYEAAVRSFAGVVCPSCERSYSGIQNILNKTPCFCVHCGLELFRNCPACGQRNFALFPHCCACGAKVRPT